MAVPDLVSVPTGSSSTPAVPRRGSRIRQGFRVGDAVDHDAAIVERDDVDGEAHPAGMDAATRHDPQPFAGLESRPVEQPDRARGASVRHRHRLRHHRTRIDVPRNQCHVSPEL